MEQLTFNTKPQILIYVTIFLQELFYSCFFSVLSSVQFSRSVMSNSLRLHGLQHARLPWPSTNSRNLLKLMSIKLVMPSNHVILCCPLLLLQPFPASGSSPMSQFFTSGGQSVGVSASASVLPIYIQDWFALGWTGWISLQSKGLWRVFSNTIVQKHQFFGAQPSSQSNSHIHTWLLEKPELWLDGPFQRPWKKSFLFKNYKWGQHIFHLNRREILWLFLSYATSVSNV